MNKTAPSRTLPGADVVCPRCGEVGQEKYRRRLNSGNGVWYYEVDHYKTFKRVGTKGLHNKYKRTCYIGRAETLPERLQIAASA